MDGLYFVNAFDVSTTIDDVKMVRRYQYLVEDLILWSATNKKRKNLKVSFSSIFLL